MDWTRPSTPKPLPRRRSGSINAVSRAVQAGDLIVLTTQTTIGRTAGATGTAATFSSSPTGTTSDPHEIAISVVSLTGGKKAPTWVAGWITSGSSNTGGNYLASAYLTTTTTTNLTATGTATGTWTATTTTFKP